MNQIVFENLLEKHISDVEKITDRKFKEVNFKTKTFEIKFYTNEDFIYHDFYGMPYYYLSIKTSKKDTVQAISIHFRQVINRQFYDAFNKAYGEPSNVLIIDKRTVISENNGEDATYGFKQYTRKSELELKEGNFEENPLYIIWKKDGYEIKALLRHEQNMSELTFKLPGVNF